MIIISPFSRRLPDGRTNPKDYVYWEQLIPLLPFHIVQVGVAEEKKLVTDFRPGLSLTELADLVRSCDTWIGCDSFFQHFCWDLGKPGIVIWGPSDPQIFGHPENINIYKSRQYLVPNQFLTWNLQVVDPDCWVDPTIVAQQVKRQLSA